ncbi:hypothetical protein PV08_10409 [Exophiala spinifera]|uniref:Jacalin-type lectin domain-containing protein n=1 Tax=Exophiala spinifera TaxID=91928 RepID=A0A0D2BIC4_9EURO|nr:uncharacterized protein PV08_10409 [Exophiala spinifera]KIW11109.1 hypothetical protein PV08_10409 [Exophiala spinifera]
MTSGERDALPWQTKLSYNILNTKSWLLYTALGKIAKAQDKTVAQLLDLPDQYQNVVFAPGFEYHGLEGLGTTLSFSAWFSLTCMVSSPALYVGAQLIFVHAGSIFAGMVEGAAAARQMGILRLARLGRALRGPGFGAAGVRALRWARFGRFLEIGSFALIPVAIGLEAWIDETDYTRLVNSIEDLAPMRLDACAHKLMMKYVSDNITRLATTASVYAEETTIASNLDIRAKLGDLTQKLIKEFNEVGEKAKAEVEQSDKDQQAYTADDPDLSKHVLELYKMSETIKITQLDVSSDFAVNGLQAQTNFKDGLRFGGPGGTASSNTMATDETITKATWKTGTLVSDEKMKVIHSLVITTNKRTLGPFGKGGSMVTTDATDQTFSCPDRFIVCGLMDLASKVVDKQGDMDLANKTYITELRFVIAPKN